MEDIKNIIESLLFVADEPLTVDRLKKLLNLAGIDEIRAALRSLNDAYESRKGGFYLREVAGGYQLRTRPDYNEWVKKLLQPKPPRLSKAALETLAIVAYKQPAIRSDIEHIRGVDCGGILRMLLERGLIRVLGRKEIPGRPLIYGTTKRFLEVFDLKNLKDLPTPKEIEELGASETDRTDETDSTASLEGVNMPTSDIPVSTGDGHDQPDTSVGPDKSQIALEVLKGPESEDSINPMEPDQTEDLAPE